MINTTYSDEIFNRYISGQSSVAYYPSAGVDDKRILEYPIDIIILSDYFSQDINGNREGHIFKDYKIIKSYFSKYQLRVSKFLEFEIQPDLSYAVFEKNNKKFLYFFEDNNNTVERIKSARLKLDALITINDGCQEGGNYECINTYSWLDNFKSNLKTDTIFVKDHFENNMFDSVLISGGDSTEGYKRRAIFERLYYYPNELEKLNSELKDGLYTKKGYDLKLKLLKEKYCTTEEIR